MRQAVLRLFSFLCPVLVVHRSGRQGVTVDRSFRRKSLSGFSSAFSSASPCSSRLAPGGSTRVRPRTAPIDSGPEGFVDGAGCLQSEGGCKMDRFPFLQGRIRDDHWHRRAYRPRQEHPGEGADRHRHRSPARRKAAWYIGQGVSRPLKISWGSVL